MKYRIIVFFATFFTTVSVGLAQDKKAYLVSNAHFDTQWNWDVQASIGEFLPNTMNHNIYLFRKFPHYIFNFEGGVKYAWMKEYYPKEFQFVKNYIQKGRWNVVGSSWDANDTNIPSPESAIRNILYAQQFYKDEFNIQTTDIFLPDCFGFSQTIPTVANHAGLIGFSTQKLQWRTNSFYPTGKTPFDIGFWKGIDGSQILSVLNGQAYDSKWTENDLTNNTKLLSLAQNNPLNWAFHYYGVGDAGGAPTVESVQAVENSLIKNGAIKIVGVKSDQLYKDYYSMTSKPTLPVFDGELLMDVHGTACYTSQAAMKLYNRKNELLADAAERAAVVSDWLGGIEYPKETLTEAWKRVLWHQFHDDLPGTSIPKAYEFSWNDELLSMKQFAGVLTSSVGNVSRALSTNVQGIPLVIFNPVSQNVSDVIIAKIKVDVENKDISVFDENGDEVASQLLSNENGIAKIAILAKVASCGYVVYDIRSEAGAHNFPQILTTSNSIENSVYRVTLDPNGDISSIKDKRYGKELVESGKRIRLALFTGNKSVDWPAWEIKKSVIDQTPVGVTNNVKISVSETGVARGGLCIERTYGISKFKQYIYLHEGDQADRIDVFNEFDWQTKNTLLKAEFPLSVSNPEATYDLGIGAIKRGNNTATAYEVCAQYWADLTDSDQSYGVSILNDSRYGWDKPNNNTLRLTLLHSPEVGGSYKYQADQDQGYHTFKYSIVGHSGDYKQASTVLKAEVLNQPMKAFVVDKHEGTYGRSLSFVSVDNKNVLIKALKQAEKSDEYVLRLYETAGEQQEVVTLNFAENIESAKNLDGVEKEIGELTPQGDQLTVTIEPFSMKTIKVKLSSPENTLSTIVNTSIPLNYNTRVTTFDQAYSEADIDGNGNSYAAELWPNRLSMNGLNFNLGDPSSLNAQKGGGEINLPPGHDYNRAYLLMSSTANDELTTIKVDNVSHSINIPSYSGFIGQWGHIGYTEGYLKDADIAYIGTHKHTSATNGKFNEVATNVIDKNSRTKYTVVGKKEFWLDCELQFPATVKSYSLSVPATLSERNPRAWTLFGWDDTNESWVVLDQQTDISFPKGASMLMFNIKSPITTSSYLLEVTNNNGGADIQLMQWQLFDESIGYSGIVVSKSENPVRILASESEIIMESESLDRLQFEIYSISGCKITGGIGEGGRASARVNPGLYIVRVNGYSTKVLVK